MIRIRGVVRAVAVRLEVVPARVAGLAVVRAVALARIVITAKGVIQALQVLQVTII